MFVFSSVFFVPGILQTAAFGALERLQILQITTFVASERLRKLQIAAFGVLERLPILQFTTFVALDRLRILQKRSFGALEGLPILQITAKYNVCGSGKITNTANCSI